MHDDRHQPIAIGHLSESGDGHLSESGDGHLSDSGDLKMNELEIYLWNDNWHLSEQFELSDIDINGFHKQWISLMEYISISLWWRHNELLNALKNPLFLIG